VDLAAGRFGETLAAGRFGETWYIRRSMEPASRRATYEDLLRIPEDVHAEIVDGQIVVLPSPRPRHSKPQRALGRFIGGPFDDDDGHGGPGGWWIFVEVDGQLGDQVVRPDLSGWRRPRLPEPDQRPISVVPDWICEVLSESNEAHDRVTKRRIYAEAGVTHYWIVDPEARTLEALILEGGKWVDAGSFDETGLARIAPFEAIELPIGRLFLPKKRDDG
jgi:Uma2 family endonuclease